MERVALMFPGQGSQYVGMGKKLYSDYNVVREVYEEANDILGYDLKTLCFEGRLSDLMRIENMFPAIVTTSYAVFQVYMEEIGIEPVCAAGHSLGEFSALVCSRAISFADILKLIKLRSELAVGIKKKTQGILAIVDSIEGDKVQEICNKLQRDGKEVAIACFNASDQTVISGVEGDVLEAGNKFMTLNAHFTPLFYSPPFHSCLMREASEIFTDKLQEINIKMTCWPVVSNVDGKIYLNREDIISKLADQIVSPVQWYNTLNVFDSYNVDTVIEIGPLALLTNLAERYSKKVHIYSFGQENDRDMLINLFGRKSREMDYFDVIKKCMVAAVATPNRNWDEQEYIEGAVKPYRHMKQAYIRKVSDQSPITLEDAKQALTMLQSVFTTKKYPKELQKVRFMKILEDTKLYDCYEFVDDCD